MKSIISHAPREWAQPTLSQIAPNMVLFRPRETLVTVVFVAIGYDVTVIDRHGDRSVWRETGTIKPAIDYAVLVSRDMGWRFVPGDATPWLEQPYLRGFAT